MESLVQGDTKSEAKQGLELGALKRKVNYTVLTDFQNVNPDLMRLEIPKRRPKSHDPVLGITS